MWTVRPDIIHCYISSINRCLMSDEHFESFKSSSHYNSIVGMATVEQAPLWYDRIKEEHPDILSSMEKFKANDSFGKPVAMWSSPSHGDISASTLRYLNTLCDIEKHFGSLDGKSVVEIGVGYGGLCFMIQTYYDVSCYQLVDIDNAILLTRKYLGKIGLDKNIMYEASSDFQTKHSNTYSTVNTLTHKEELKLSSSPSYDLAISEFCISEMDDKGINDYYNRYLKPSKRLYLLMNLHDVLRKERFIKMVEEDFDIKMLDEFPKTHWPNYLMIAERR